MLPHLDRIGFTHRRASEAMTPFFEHGFQTRIYMSCTVVEISSMLSLLSFFHFGSSLHALFPTTGLHVFRKNSDSTAQEVRMTCGQSHSGAVGTRHVASVVTRSRSATINASRRSPYTVYLGNADPSQICKASAKRPLCTRSRSFAGFFYE